MTMVQMNVRLDADLKRRGDAVLRKRGMTPSRAVREWYEDLVDDVVSAPGDAIPKESKRFKAAADDVARERRRGERLRTLRELGDVIPRICARYGMTLGDDPIDRLSDEEYKGLRRQWAAQEYGERLRCMESAEGASA